MLVKTRTWDPAEYLEMPEDVAAYLDVALEEGDPVMLQVVLGDVARSRGMAAIAREAGVGRESLYKSLSEDGNPSWQTVMKVINALGLRLEVTVSAAD